MGKKIVEGFLNPLLKKFEKYIKNFKHVASFSFLQKDSSGNFNIGYAKVPFMREDDIKEFEKSFNEVLSLLSAEQEKKDKDESKEVNEKKEDNKEETGPKSD